MNRGNGISVIVCCYNSSARLKPTLEHLFAQQFSQPLNWEIIVIDNNSTDNTAYEANRLYANSNKSIPFQVVSEQKPGLSFAREKGFQTAMHNILLMVDDDNSLCPNYVETIHRTFQSDNGIGMVGGLGIPVIENEAPEWFNRYAYCFATGPQNGNSAEPESLYGAGLGLRLDILDRLKSAGFTSLLSDRTGNSLLSGGDTELCMAYRMAGFKLKYVGEITFEHHLPSGRINWKYLRRLFHGFGITKARLDIYRNVIAGRPIPKSGRIPFWLDRCIYLSKQLLPDLPILVRGWLNPLEGSDQLLRALAKLGHIQGIYRSRKEYEELFIQVESLKKNLANG